MNACKRGAPLATTSGRTESAAVPRRSLDFPALFSERGQIESPDEQTRIGRLHSFLAQSDALMLWYIAVVSLGLEKVGGVSFGRAALWLYGVGAVLVAAAVLPGWGR